MGRPQLCESMILKAYLVVLNFSYTYRQAREQTEKQTDAITIH